MEEHPLSGLIETNHVLRTPLLSRVAARLRTMDLEVAPRPDVSLDVLKVPIGDGRQAIRARFHDSGARGMMRR